MLTQEEIKQLNEQVDIGALLVFLGVPAENIQDLNRKGVDYRVNAFYRGGDNPHGVGITYNFDKRKWFVTDFTHGEFGNIDLLDFMTKVLKIPFSEAIDRMVFASGKKNGFEKMNRSIASSGAKPLQKLERPVPIDPSVASLFEQGLHSYWQRRGYNHETAKVFELGFCPAQYGNLKHRLTIPITDEFNRLVAIQGRTIDDEEEPKYTYTNSSEGESAKLTLYNYPRARYYAKQRGWVGVVESANSVWRADQYGYKNFVATLSTSVTDRQLELLVALQLNVTIFFDYDPYYTMAGQIGAMKLAQRLIQRGVRVWIVNIGFEADAAELTLDQFNLSLKNARQYTGGQ